MYTILIADDHPSVRIGMKMIIQNVYPSSQIDFAVDAASVVEKLKLQPYHLILLDINMPDSDTVGLMNWINNFRPDTRVLVCSMNQEETYGKRFLQLGARGYLKKSAGEDEIARALHLVMDNKKYVSAEMAALLTEEFIGRKSGNPFDHLSPREFEIVTFLLKGNTLNEVCSIMNIQYSTVCTHKQKVFEKLKVSSILQLSDLAKSYGLASV